MDANVAPIPAARPVSVRVRASSLAWVAGPAAVGLGLVAHLVSGGQPPAVLILAALTAVMCLAAQLIARLSVPGWALLVLSGLVQQLLHLAFDVFSGSFPGPGFPGHPHTGREELLQLGADSGAGAPGADSGAGAGSEGAMHTAELMLHTHVAAAILTVLVLAGMDRLMRRRHGDRPGVGSGRRGSRERSVQRRPMTHGEISDATSRNPA